MVLPFENVDEMPWCYHSNETFLAVLSHGTIFFQVERFSYDLETKTREQNRNNKRTEIERFDWFIERSGEKTSCPRTFKKSIEINLTSYWNMIMSSPY